MIKSLPFSLVAITLLPGCPLLETEVEVSEVCLTYPNIQVDAALAGATSINSSFTFDALDAIHDLTDLDADLELVRADATLTSGVASFDFVRSAHLTIASGDPQSTLPTLALYDCDGNCLASGVTLDLTGDVRHQLVDYAKGDSIVGAIDFTGEMPATAWTMDVSVCMKGHVGVAVEP